MNHCAHFVRHLSTPPTLEDYLGNVEVGFVDTQGREVGPETQSRWLRPNPPGFRRMLGWISGRYGGPRIYVTENGTCVKGENELTREERLEDEFRVEYFRGYVRAMAEAVGEDGVDVRGYWAWSLMEYVAFSPFFFFLLFSFLEWGHCGCVRGPKADPGTAFSSGRMGTRPGSG